jgi:hypothetical protein
LYKIRLKKSAKELFQNESINAIATALDVAVTCYAFSMSDCILKIDPATKTLEVLL